MTDHAGARSFFKSPLPVINPPSVAIVGASERARWPTDIFNNLGKGGFPGKIYPVNPRAAEVWGQRAYPDLASLPEAPSHALIIVPAPAVLDVLEKGVAAGLGPLQPGRDLADLAEDLPQPPAGSTQHQQALARPQVGDAPKTAQPAVARKARTSSMNAPTFSCRSR